MSASWPSGSLSLPLADGTRLEVVILPDGRRLLSVTRPYPGCEHVTVELPKDEAALVGGALRGGS